MSKRWTILCLAIEKHPYLDLKNTYKFHKDANLTGYFSNEMFPLVLSFHKSLTKQAKDPKIHNLIYFLVNFSIDSLCYKSFLIKLIDLE